MKKLFFYLGAGTLFTHELDAVLNHEWKVLPLTSWLPDEYGALVFIFAHIPLFAIVLWLISHQKESIRFRSQIWISIFLILHGMLHLLFVGNVNYKFNSLSSNILIFGVVVLGMGYLLLEFREKGSKKCP